jgi:5-methyltetrahydrofolate--homocysteine methyltransferase
MLNQKERHQALLDAFASRILIIDGAMGSLLFQKIDSGELQKDRDYGGYPDTPEILNVTKPEAIADIHRQYFEAGADIVETNTFGTTRIVLDDFDLGERDHELSFAGAAIARKVADQFSTSEKPRFVAGSMGPTTKTVSVTANIGFQELAENFYHQAKALVEGGVDILLLETCLDTLNIKAGLVGIERLGRELGYRVPTMVSGTIERNGTMLGGQTAEALYTSLSHAELLTVGLNCATGPEFMTDHMRTLTALSDFGVSCYPNAGIPDAETGKFGETPASLAAQLAKFMDQRWLNIVGGCCGTTPAHIAAIAETAAKYQPRPKKVPSHRAFYSGIEVIEADETNRPLLVGERTNVIGSRAFKNLIAEEKWEEAAEVGRRQVRNGAHIVDVCLQSSDRDEVKDIPHFYSKLIKLIKAPIMVDTTDPDAVELSLSYSQGKAIINSINLEDGEEKLERMAPVIKRYGAAVVVGTIDEDKLQAQAFTRERKLSIAQRSVDLLTSKYGLQPEDIIIDPLVFPCATGDENYIGGAVETIESLRLIKDNIPFVKTVLGVSNISFGLPPAAREVVNSVFLYHCTKAGLDLAIVNTEKLERFASIPEEERHLAESLLYNWPPASDEVEESHPQRAHLVGSPMDWREQSKEQKAAINQFRIAKITEFFRGRGAKQKASKVDLPLNERLAQYIIEGTKEGLVDDLELKRAEGAAPLEIINGPLMKGMDEVGRLFNNNELIVAEVLQSAEAMKAAVNHLRQFMEKSESSTRGKIVLATVKGDVHDIGKNLVEIILSNNGYDVVNLGIKIPSDQLIAAAREHQPDAIGLSGLLVKSAHQMVTTGNDLKEAGVKVPLLVGGAALSEKFTLGKIAPAYDAPTFYAKDAMTGLALMNEIMDTETREKAFQRAASATDKAQANASAAPKVKAFEGDRETPSIKVRRNLAPVAAPYADLKVRSVPQLAEVWSYINPFMLFGRHLGYKGNFEKALAERDPRALELFHQIEEVKRQAAEYMKIKATWQYFDAERAGNSIQLYVPGSNDLAHTFQFQRQDLKDGLCLSDYVLPANGTRDSLALFVVGAGEGIRQRSEELKAKGEFLASHAVQALALETAEACAEWLHRRIREDWGFADPTDLTMQQRFTSRYRGKRYSFGYPACPSLEDQEGIWKLLKPESIGVQLTEGWMMEPEASVSALVFHHPDCAYYSVEATEAVGVN